MSFGDRGRGNALSCLLVLAVVAVSGFLVVPRLSESPVGAVRRIAELPGGRAIGAGSAVVGAVATVLVLMVVLAVVYHLHRAHHRRRWARLEAILAGRSEAAPEALERLADRVLAVRRKPGGVYWGLEDSEILLDAARKGPYRATALHLLLHHGREWPLDAAHIGVVREGAALLEEEALSRHDRFRLERMVAAGEAASRGPSDGGARGGPTGA